VTPDQITEVMRLASMLATARCRRLVANSRNGGATEVDQAEQLVQRRTIELRTYLETFQCPEPSSAPSTNSTN
jgi:hypothetical protein